MKNLIGQAMKFTFVGGLAFIIDYVVLIAMTELLGINYLVSSGFSFSISVIFNYVLSVKWVFSVNQNRNKSQEFVLFVGLSVIGLLLNQMLMWLFVEKYDVFYMFSKIIVTIIVMVYNFITRKVFLEKQ